MSKLTLSAVRPHLTPPDRARQNVHYRQCAGTATAACAGTAVGRFRWAVGVEPRPLCAACRATLERLGLGLVEVLPEPAWVTRARERRLPAKVIA